jgi:hypothetical protein
VAEVPAEVAEVPAEVGAAALAEPELPAPAVVSPDVLPIPAEGRSPFARPVGVEREADDATGGS